MIYINLLIYSLLIGVYYFYCDFVKYVPLTTQQHFGENLATYTILSYYISFGATALICLIIYKIQFNNIIFNFLKIIFIFILFQFLMFIFMIFGYLLFEKTHIVFFTLFSISKQHAFWGDILLLSSIFIGRLIKKSFSHVKAIKLQ